MVDAQILAVLENLALITTILIVCTREQGNLVARNPRAKGSRAINQHTIIAKAAQQPRARGTASLSVRNRAGKNVIGDLYQSGSSKCLFPRSAHPAMDAVILNTAGGVTGGDKFAFTGHAAPGSALTLTTQACERVYKAQPSQVGEIDNALKIDSKARINWLPQETILFDHAALERRLTVELARDASFLMLEALVFGRAAMGEVLSHASLRDRIEITRDGVPLFMDATHLQGNVSAHLAKPNTANGAGAMATLIFVHASAEAELPKLRALLPETAGASLLAPDTLILRLLASDSFLLRQSLLPIMLLLNNGHVPRCWMI